MADSTIDPNSDEYLAGIMNSAGNAILLVKNDLTGIIRAHKMVASLMPSTEFHYTDTVLKSVLMMVESYYDLFYNELQEHDPHHEFCKDPNCDHSKVNNGS